VQTAIPDRIVGRVLEGRYRVLERLARGGMSTVYRALDERLDREVAVKVMSAALSTDPAFADRFAREARVAARLSHLNAVAVYDQGTDDGHVFLVMELVRGRTLRDLLRERGALSPAQAVSIMEPMLGALAAAHRAGLVHRDIKPENILLADDGAVKVADFGLARAVESDASSTRTGLMMGTVAYCPPEQISRGSADARADVYSAGVVLFELLTGSAPYVGDSAMAVAYQHVNCDIEPPSSRRPGIPAQLDDVVLRATSREPSGRPLDAGAFLAELHDVRVDLGLPVTPVPPRPRPDDGDPNRTQVIAGVPDGHPPAPGPQRLPGPVAANPLATAAAASAATTSATTAPTRYGIDPTRHTAVTERPAAPDRPETPKRSPAAERRRRGRRRTLIVAVVIVLLGLLTGYGAWWFTVGRYHQVPDLSGQPRSVATDALVSGGFVVASGVDEQFSEQVPTGSVISTNPAAHTHLLRGKAVQLVISRGPERFTVPRVEGVSFGQAQQALAAMPVQVVRSDAADASGTFAAGTVMKTSPAAGAKVKRAAVLTVVVSSGPPVIAVPDVGGKTRPVAEAALRKAGFTVQFTDDFSDTVPDGSVLRQSPAARQRAVKFSQVSVVLSKGPELVTIPDISNGTDADQAKQTLQGVGLTVKIDKRFGGFLNKVVGMDPKSGTQVRRGSQVILTVV
jgi:serine/threonine protein kinase/beta-lactam-binding protein with PASTA domain